MTGRRLRLALAALLMTAAVGINGLIPVSAWVETSATGQTGERKMVDSSTFAGVVCHNDLTSFPGSIAIEARDVLLKPAAGYSIQTVSVQYLLYQELPGGTLDLITRSPVANKQTEASVWARFGPHTFVAQALGPRYVVVAEMIWYDVQGIPSGRVRARVSNYESRTTLQGGDYTTGKAQTYCASPKPAAVSVGSTRGTVQSTISYSLRYYPAKAAVSMSWDGKTIGTVMTTATGEAAGKVAAPAAPMGTHQLQWTVGNWRSAATFTIVPRIKLIPNAVSRGQTVNVSLRGYAAREVVRIRWKKGSSWVELARVTTSSTGSANVYVKVPSWAPNGPASVRGDGTHGRAQTNAVTVSGGPFSASAVKTATPTPTATEMLTPAPTMSPQTPDPTATATPIAETPSPEVTETTIAETPAPTESPTPTASVPLDASPVP